MHDIVKIIETGAKCVRYLPEDRLAQSLTVLSHYGIDPSEQVVFLGYEKEPDAIRVSNVLLFLSGDIVSISGRMVEVKIDDVERGCLWLAGNAPVGLCVNDVIMPVVTAVYSPKLESRSPSVHVTRQLLESRTAGAD